MGLKWRGRTLHYQASPLASETFPQRAEKVSLQGAAGHVTVNRALDDAAASLADRGQSIARLPGQAFQLTKPEHHPLRLTDQTEHDGRCQDVGEVLPAGARR